MACMAPSKYNSLSVPTVIDLWNPEACTSCYYTILFDLGNSQTLCHAASYGRSAIQLPACPIIYSYMWRVPSYTVTCALSLEVSLLWFLKAFKQVIIKGVRNLALFLLKLMSLAIQGGGGSMVFHGSSSSFMQVSGMPGDLPRVFYHCEME